MRTFPPPPLGLFYEGTAVNLKVSFCFETGFSYESLASPELPMLTSLASDLESSVLTDEGQQGFPALSFLEDVSGVTCFSWLKENQKHTN